MKIISVKDQQYSRYIPLKGWSSVEAALNTYSNGFIKSSRATENKTVDDMERSSGSLAGAMFVLGTSLMANRDKFVDDMLSEAKSTIKGRDHWEKGFDYDGVGTRFFKTTVEVSVLDREADLFALGIHAAYVGDKPEGELAEYLSIPRALIRSTITVQVEPVETDRFAFDFEQIIRKLDSVLGTTELTGETVAQAMLRVDNWGESRPTFILEREDGFTISIFPDRVERRFGWVDPFGPGRRQIDTWSVDGAVLSGTLDKSYEDRTKKELPSFAINISYCRKTNYGDENLPTYDEKKKNAIILLTNAIAKALEA